jgi:hypothetical protein
LLEPIFHASTSIISQRSAFHDFGSSKTFILLWPFEQEHTFLVYFNLLPLMTEEEHFVILQVHLLFFVSSILCFIWLNSLIGFVLFIWIYCCIDSGDSSLTLDFFLTKSRFRLYLWQILRRLVEFCQLLELHQLVKKPRVYASSPSLASSSIFARS